MVAAKKKGGNGAEHVHVTSSVSSSKVEFAWIWIARFCSAMRPSVWELP